MPADALDAFLDEGGAGGTQAPQPATGDSLDQFLDAPGGALSTPPAPTPDVLERSTLGAVSRGNVMAVGGTVGGVLGAPAGPAGVVGGAALGAGAGSYAYDLAENIARKLGTPQRAPRGLGESTREALGGATEEAAFSLLPGAAPAYRAVKAKIAGVAGAGAQAAARAAESIGIPIGISHVTERSAVRGWSQVLGGFPFVGTPFRAGQARVVGALDDHAADLLNTLAPTTTAPQAATGMYRAAASRYDKFDTVSSALYKRFYDLADALPPGQREIVPTAPIKEWLGELEARLAKQEITLESGERMAGLGTDEVGEWLKQLRGLPSRVSVEQARWLERELNASMGKARAQGWDISRLSGLKEALQSAKTSLDLGAVPPEQAQRIMGAWERANSFFHTARQPFESATAKRFGRVERNVFGHGAFVPGTKNADELFSDVFHSRSPEALDDLRKLVGTQPFRNATRAFLERELRAARLVQPEGSVVPELFSAQRFSKALGLSTPEGRATLETMLRGSGVPAGDFYRFLSVAQNATDITIRNPSTYLMRRLTLGGLTAGSIMGSALFAGASVSIPYAMLLTAALRQGSKALMNPRTLRELTVLGDPNVNDYVRKATLLRVLRTGLQESGGEPIYNEQQ